MNMERSIDCGLKVFVENAPLILVIRMRMVCRFLNAVAVSVLETKYTRHTKRRFIDVLQLGDNSAIGEFGDYDVVTAWYNYYRRTRMGYRISYDTLRNFGHAIGWSNDAVSITFMLDDQTPRSRDYPRYFLLVEDTATVKDAVVEGVVSTSGNVELVNRSYLNTESVWAVADGPSQCRMFSILGKFCCHHDPWDIRRAKYEFIVEHFDTVVETIFSHAGVKRSMDAHCILRTLAERDDVDNMIKILQLFGGSFRIPCVMAIPGGRDWLPVIASTELIDAGTMMDCVLWRNKLDDEYDILQMTVARGAKLPAHQMLVTKDPRVMSMWLDQNSNFTKEQLETHLCSMEDWKMEMVAERFPRFGAQILRHAAHRGFTDAVVCLVEKLGVKITPFMLTHIYPKDPSITAYLESKVTK